MLAKRCRARQTFSASLRSADSASTCPVTGGMCGDCPGFTLTLDMNSLTTTVESTEPAEYRVSPVESQASVEAKEDGIIGEALQILARRIARGPVFDSPFAVRDFLTVRAGAHEDQARERFCVLFLDSQHHMIEIRTMFEGTLSQTSVYPREIVRAALALNASAVILTHNHPSGTVEPSRADQHLTKIIKDALALVDVRVLDHIITGGGESLSMAEKGLI